VEDIQEPPGDPLAAILEVAQANQRLSPAQEDEAALSLKAKFCGSKTEIESALSLSLKLQWNVAVKALTAAWPEMNVTAKRTLFPALNRLETDQGKRLRLSLARGLNKLDSAAAIRIVSGWCAAAKKQNLETGLPPKERQSFFNVLIGKGKPWLFQWKWEDYKPTDIPSIVFCVLSTGFQGNCPPLTQASLLRWASGSKKMDKLPDVLIAAIKKEVGRWKSRLREQTKKDCPEAPDWLTEALLIVKNNKPETTPEQAEKEAVSESTESEDKENPETPDDEPTAAESIEKPKEESPAEPQEAENSVPEAKPESRPSPPRQREPDRTVRVTRITNDRSSERRLNETRPDRTGEPRGERARFTAAVASVSTGSSTRTPDFSQLLRQLDSQFQALKSELATTKAMVRQRDEEMRRGKHVGFARRRKPGDIENGSLPDPHYDMEELARHNAQLEERIQELQSQLTDLSADVEVRAISRQESADDSPETALQSEHNSLMAHKLEIHLERYRELTAGPQNELLIEHYRKLVSGIFSSLVELGIPLDQPVEETLPVRATRSMKSWKSH